MHSSMLLPPLENLEAMLAAARLGSFSAAAEELELTHGSISRRISAIEAWLGTPLFTRHARGVRLTPAGEHFSRQVQSALNQISQVAVDLRKARATPSRLRLSVLPSMARLWLMPRLATIQRSFPGLILQVVTEHRMAHIDGSDADLAIRYGAGRWPGTQAHLLMRERLFAVASPKLAKTLSGRSASALMRETLLHDSDTDHWRSWCKHAQIRYREHGNEHRFDDYDLVLSAAEEGLGLAIARWPLVADVLKSGRLVRLGDVEFPGVKAHYVVMRQGEVRSPVLRLANALIAQAEAD